MGLPLQKAVIESLTQLRENSPYYAELTSYIDDLQKEGTVIRKSDYGPVITLFILMCQELPGVLDHPNAETVRDLLRHCVQQLNLLVELKVKAALLRGSSVQPETPDVSDIEEQHAQSKMSNWQI